MADESAPAGRTENTAEARPARLWLAAGAIILTLFAVYWFFIRGTFVPVLVNLEPQDAADVAKVLDAKKVIYRFQDEGRTIAVESGAADKARVELAGSELPMKGQIGFELFNQSDMGLTEFAQKINFQRALQGELARTILLLDGIQTVRVHLGLPDHSVFRDEQSPPKASVTLILKPGKSLSSATVSGIQRLVAGAVPDMTTDAVAVLDGSGKIVSPDSVPSPLADAGSDAVVQDIRARLVASFTKNHPDLRIGVNVSLRFKPGQLTSQTPSDQPKPDLATPSELPPRGVPDYAYVIRVTTERAMEEGLRSDIARMVSAETGFDLARGDTVVFLVGPVQGEPSTLAKVSGSEEIVSKAAVPQAFGKDVDWWAWWPVIPLVAIAALALAYWNDRRRGQAGRANELASFTEELRQRLEAEGAS